MTDFSLFCLLGILKFRIQLFRTFSEILLNLCKYPAPGTVLVSLMRQYTPIPGLPAPFDRPITDEEYDAVLSWMLLNDLEGFTQESSAADSQFIPDF